MGASFSTSSPLPSTVVVSNPQNSQKKKIRSCKCNTEYWKCQHIRHQGFPLIQDFSGDKFIPIKHHCIKIQIQCKNCDRIFYITLENIKSKNVRFFSGIYESEVRCFQEQVIDMTYYDFNVIFQSFSNRKYKLFSYNCIHFAYEFYRIIVERNVSKPLHIFC